MAGSGEGWMAVTFFGVSTYRELKAVQSLGERYRLISHS
jgi:hypothetical protein